MSDRPNDYEAVEILVNGIWLKAFFMPGDDFCTRDGDEYWWMDHFVAADFAEYPNAQDTNAELPEWRRIAKPQP